jgi:hypothetical protein
MIFALAILRLVNSFHRVAPTIAQPTGEELIVQSCAYGTYSSSHVFRSIMTTLVHPLLSHALGWRTVWKKGKPSVIQSKNV